MVILDPTNEQLKSQYKSLRNSVTSKSRNAELKYQSAQLLFKKLIKRKVPFFIVRLLIVWYSLQRMHIRWGNTFSTSFCVSNGVKQGGIISPVLFNVYMVDLSCALNRSNIGGRIGGEIVNHLSYADDLCLIWS